MEAWHDVWYEPFGYVTATRDTWKNTPLPEARKPIAYGRTFTRDELARIVRGLEPKEMEDKWFVFYEAPWLFFHRSRTGICIYALRLRQEGVVEEALVNRAPEEYRETDDAHDVALLGFLVDALLLGRDMPFPIRNKDLTAEKRSLLKHHVIGHGGKR